VALNPVIKFATLFGLLAVELAVSLKEQGGGTLTAVLAVVFLIASMYFVYRSFYGMTIGEKLDDVVVERPLEVDQAA
jgi:K(+)-stimulated pyrophosphate-energized sodium pump